MPDGDSATIREVYQLVDARSADILAAVNALAVRVEGIDGRLQSHTQLDAHPGTALQLRNINMTLAKYAGGLGVLITGVGFFLKFV